MKKLKQLNKTERKELRYLNLFYSNITNIFYDNGNNILDNYSDNKKDPLRGYYKAIPFCSAIIDLLATIKKNFPDKKSFLDIGSGKSNILALAYTLGFDPKGIEIRDYPKFYFAPVFNIDAFDFKKYHQYDIVYAYMPMFDEKLMNKLLVQVCKTMKPGALLIFPLNDEATYKIIERDFNFINLSKGLYQKPLQNK